MSPDFCVKTSTEAFLVDLLTAVLLPFAVLALWVTAAWDRSSDRRR